VEDRDFPVRARGPCRQTALPSQILDLRLQARDLVDGRCIGRSGSRGDVGNWTLAVAPEHPRIWSVIYQ
jgi:hypothetical protein